MSSTADSSDSDSATLEAATRPVRFDVDGADTALVVTALSGAEALCQPFRFELSLLTEDSDLAFADVLGQKATLTVDLPAQDARYWHGIVTAFTQHAHDERFTYFRATLEPALAALRLRRDCRVFQDQKVDDLLATMLAGVATRTAYTKADDRQPRHYCVQYRETDLAFVQRLVEESGLLYYFENDDSACTVVLADDSTQLDAIESLSPIEYGATDGGVQSDPSVKSWAKTQSLAPTGVTVRDTHFQKPRDAFEASHDQPADFSVGQSTHKPSPAGASYGWFEFPGGYTARYDSVGNHEQDPDPAGFETSPIQYAATDAEAAAQLACERLLTQSIQIAAESDALAVSPGGLIKLDGHPTDDGKFLIVAVTHELTVGSAESGGDGQPLHYANRFACHPADTPYRPPLLTPKPLVGGVQTAMVVADSTDNEADPKKLCTQLYDKYGRVKVWFPWDRRDEKPAEGEPPEGAAGPTDRSCWVRVAQVWAGKRWGAFFWPRHGHEVLVAFEHGDPDRPVIVGSVYNADNMPPMEMPAQQDLAGIKSCSVGGDPSADFNGLTFYDEIGNEHLEIHSEAHTVNHNEHSEHVFTRGSSVRVRGRMFGGLDSGSGGGPRSPAAPSQSGGGAAVAAPPSTTSAPSAAAAEAPASAGDAASDGAQDDGGAERDAPPKLANLFASKSSHTKRWDKLLTALGYESDIEVTLGHGASIVTGIPWGTSSEILTGGSMSMVVDPSGYLPEGKISQVQDLVVPLGEWTALFGSGRSLHYGPATTIHHGSEIERRSAQKFDKSNIRAVWAGGIITASTALSLLAWRKERMDPKAWETYVRKLGPRGLCGMLLNLLLEYEKAEGEADAGTEKQCEAASLNDQIDSLGADYQSLLLDLAGKATDAGSKLASAGAADLAAQQADADSEDTSTEDAEEGADDDDSGDAGDADDAGDGADADASQQDDDPDTSDLSYGDGLADVYETYDGLLATSARHVSLRARVQNPDDSSDDGPSLIHLDAQGGGDDNGVVAINSTGQATIVCGPAAFQVRRSGDQGQIDGTVGDDGAITFTAGGDSGSKAVMDPDGITLSVGAEGSGAVIKITSDGIKLSVGPDGGPCLELTTSGVTMSTGSNSVAVDQSGQTTSAMNISHEAQVAFAGKGVMTSLEASGKASVKGAITMIN